MLPDMRNAPSSAVVACASQLAVDAFSGPNLNMLFLRAGLDKHVPREWYSKSELVSAGITSALKKRNDPAVAKPSLPGSCETPGVSTGFLTKGGIGDPCVRVHHAL
jgi:hypothetical protein